MDSSRHYVTQTPQKSVSAEAHDAFADANTLSFVYSLTPKIHAALDEISEKYPGQRLHPTDHIAVITEEWGEAVADVLKTKRKPEKIEAAKVEMAQTIACIVRLYHELERVEAGIAEEEDALYSAPF